MVYIDYENKTVSCKLPSGTKIHVIGNYFVEVELHSGKKTRLHCVTKIRSIGKGVIAIQSDEHIYEIK